MAQLGPDAQASSFPLLGAPSEFLACRVLSWLEQVKHPGQGTTGTASFFGFPFGNFFAEAWRSLVPQSSQGAEDQAAKTTPSSKVKANTD